MAVISETSLNHNRVGRNKSVHASTNTHKTLNLIIQFQEYQYIHVREESTPLAMKNHIVNDAILLNTTL